VKAVYITKHGGTETLVYDEVDQPDTGPTEVKIKVRACALNRLDIFTRAGQRGTRIDFNGPHILGSDVAGEVVETGTNVSRVDIGDRVVVNPRIICSECAFCIRGEPELCVNSGMLGVTTNGGYAEYVSVEASNVVQLPRNLSYEQAASMPTVFLPCWSIMLRKAALKPWETVLIPSASSGVGTAGIQVAKNVIGARVITTTSTDDKMNKARDLGADEVINYNVENVAKRVKELTDGKGVDVVLDHVGTDFWTDAISSLAVGGRYGICGATSGYKVDLQIGLLFLRHQTIFGVFMGRNEDLRQIIELAGRGVIRGVIYRSFPLAEVAEAHKMMEDINFFGKILVTIP